MKNVYQTPAELLLLYLTYNKATKQLFGRIADSLKWQEFKKAA